jgi:hypothetical protein
MESQNLLSENLLLYVAIFLAGALAFYLLRKTFSLFSESNKNIRPSTMSTRVIRTMVNQYRTNQLKSINNSLGINDAYTVSFNLKALKNFIISIENETKKVKPDVDESDLGVRLYYAAYPKENINEDLPRKDYAGLHTIIMIPTLKLRNKEGAFLEYDFNPLDRSTYSKNINPENEIKIKAMMMSNTEESSEEPSEEPSEVVALNHGSLIPPATKTELTY